MALFTVVDIKSHKIRRGHLAVAIATLLPMMHLTSPVYGVLNYLGYRGLYGISRKRIGYGDVRLAFLMGLYSSSLLQSFKSLLWINVYAWAFAGVFTLVYLMMTTKGLNDRVAFAPFMFLGVLATALIGK